MVQHRLKLLAQVERNLSGTREGKNRSEIKSCLSGKTNLLHLFPLPLCVPFSASGLCLMVELD